MAHDFGWTARVEFTHPDDVEVQCSHVLRAISRRLAGRGAIEHLGLTGPRIGIGFGVNGSSEEEAADNTRQIVGETLTHIGIGWLTVTAVRVRGNQDLLAHIEGIDPHTGVMRPNAPVIQLFKADENTPRQED